MKSSLPIYCVLRGEAASSLDASVCGQRSGQARRLFITATAEVTPPRIEDHCPSWSTSEVTPVSKLPTRVVAKGFGLHFQFIMGTVGAYGR